MANPPKSFGVGHIGGLHFQDLNALEYSIEAAENVAANPALPADINDPLRDVQSFLVRPIGHVDNPSHVFSSRVHWLRTDITSDADFDGGMLDDSLGDGIDSFGQSNPPDIDTWPAMHLPPPHGMVHMVQDTYGNTRPVYIAAQTVYGVSLVPAGFPNGTYTATAIDNSFVFQNLTPVDRHAGNDYATPAGHGMLMMLSRSTAILFAFEAPSYTQCAPGPAQQSDQPFPSGMLSRVGQNLGGFAQ